MLQIQKLKSGYEDNEILHEVDFMLTLPIHLNILYSIIYYA